MTARKFRVVDPDRSDLAEINAELKAINEQNRLGWKRRNELVKDALRFSRFKVGDTLCRKNGTTGRQLRITSVEANTGVAGIYFEYTVYDVAADGRTSKRGRDHWLEVTLIENFELFELPLFQKREAIRKGRLNDHAQISSRSRSRPAGRRGREKR